MNRNLVTIIKKDQVRFGGTVCLTAGGGRASALTSDPDHADSSAVSVPQEARVIESNSDYAVIEVTCSCGNKMHIQCNYAAMKQEQPSVGSGGQK